MKHILITLTLTLLFPATSPAQVEQSTARYFYRMLDSDERSKFFLMGVGEAGVFFNAILQENGQKRIYCQPDISLSIDNYIEIFKKTYVGLGGDDQMGNLPPQPILIHGLKKTFPCE